MGGLAIFNDRNTPCGAMATLKQIQAYADEVVRRFHPEKIILFGSHAYGRPTRDSDVDLLVIMAHEGRPPEQAARIRDVVPAPFPLDLLVRSPQRLRERLGMNDYFMREIVDKGRSLHES
jgi:predicted nucleotidyltransferase